MLEAYNAIWDEISNLFEKGFDIESVYENKYIRTKIKLCNGTINTNFQGNRIPEEGVQCVCIATILFDSVVKVLYINILRNM